MLKKFVNYLNINSKPGNKKYLILVFNNLLQIKYLSNFKPYDNEKIKQTADKEKNKEKPIDIKEKDSGNLQEKVFCEFRFDDEDIKTNEENDKSKIQKKSSNPTNQNNTNNKNNDDNLDNVNKC